MDNEHQYKDNMHIIDHIINELMIIRVTEEIEDFDKASSILFLKLFPYVSEKANIIEGMWENYVKEHTVKEWYDSLFKKEIINKTKSS